MFVVALLPGVARSQRGASSSPPAFATELLRSDSITAYLAVTSPDGRWIVFQGIVRQQSAVWIMPAGGGAPRRLTGISGKAWRPAWFPSSDRIAYGAPGMVMTQAIDPGTGAAKGAPKRVTLDEGEMLDVSPDASFIAYTTNKWSDGKQRLQLVPARGGPARVIHSAANLFNPRFAPDGQSVFVTLISSSDGMLMRKPSQLLRVPAQGGSAAVVLEAPFMSGPLHFVDAKIALIKGPDHYTAVTFSGDTVWSIPSPAMSRATRLTGDGKSMLMVTWSIGTSIRLFPLNGGVPRDLTTGNAYDYPAGWSTDGKRLLIAPESQKEKGLLSVSVDGRQREFIPFPADSAWSEPQILGDGHLWVFPHLSSATDRYLSVYDTKARTLSTVARSANLKAINGPGGYWTGVPALHYLDRGADGMELRKLGDDGQLRTVRRLSFDMPSTAKKVSFANDRLVYWVTAGDSAILYVADPDRAPKRVYALRGSVGESSLSFDGRTLAASTLSGPARGTALRHVTLFGLTPSGDLAGEPRSIQTNMVYDLMWLRDNRSVLALEEVDDGLVIRVVKFSMDAARPVNVTAGEPMTFWDQYPSPDGRWTALPVEKARGGTIWRVDLEAAAKAWRARTRK
jgi:Tol biopolymer transport system component